MAIIIFLSILSVFFAIWIGASVYAVASTEKPKYKLISDSDVYEIRQYESQIIAQVELPGNHTPAMKEGFKILADFIFGNNSKKESMSMTSPVKETIKSEKIKMTAPVYEIRKSALTSSTDPVSKKKKSYKTRIIQFVMPSKYSLETLPKPNNPKIEIHEIPAHKAAVLRYTGFTTGLGIKMKKAELKEMLLEDKKEIIGDMISAQYNPPFTFPYVRRNEIIARIK